MKQLPGKEKGTWWKAIVRLVDQKGQGLYAEIRGSSESSVRKRAQEFYQPKFIQLMQAVVVQNSPFLSGFSADVTNKWKVSPVAEAHASAMKLRGLFPTARSNFGVLTEHFTRSHCMHIQEKMGDSNTEGAWDSSTHGGVSWWHGTWRLASSSGWHLSPRKRKRVAKLARDTARVGGDTPLKVTPSCSVGNSKRWASQPGREAHLLLFPTEHDGVTFKGVSPPTRSAVMERLHWK